MRAVLVAALAFAPVLLAKVSEPVQRLDEAAAVFSEVMAAPDSGIPQDLLEKAYSVVIVPLLKTAAFVFEGKSSMEKATCCAGTRAGPVGRRQGRSE